MKSDLIFHIIMDIFNIFCFGLLVHLIVIKKREVKKILMDHTFTFTQEEVNELTRTLLGRLDLDLDPKRKEAAKNGKINSYETLNKLYNINFAILLKVSSKSQDFI